VIAATASGAVTATPLKATFTVTSAPAAAQPDNTEIARAAPIKLSFFVFSIVAAVRVLGVHFFVSATGPTITSLKFSCVMADAIFVGQRQPCATQSWCMRQISIFSSSLSGFRCPSPKHA
jgi:hypothetical protein